MLVCRVFITVEFPEGVPVVVAKLDQKEHYVMALVLSTGTVVEIVRNQDEEMFGD